MIKKTILAWIAYLFFGVLQFCPLTIFAQVAPQHSLQSPSNKVLLSVYVEQGTLSYKIDYMDSPAFLPSRLCWNVNGNLLGNKVEAYSLQSTGIAGGYRYMILALKEKRGMEYLLEMRVYDCGVAFRYKINGEENYKVRDCTTFCLPNDCMCWMQTNTKNYEGLYEAYRSGYLPRRKKAGPPVTIKYSLPGIYAAITEGGINDFAGMSLKVTSGNTFESETDGITCMKGSVATPWRVVMIGSLNDLVNNSIIHDVSAPLSPIFEGDTGWIQPGCCVWSWLAGYAVTLDNMKKFSDWASLLGIPYNLVDEGWSRWEDKKQGKDCWQLLKELVRYSASKGVKIFLWKAYPDRHGVEGIQTPERRARFFQQCREAGIAGIKIDFLDSESQAMNRYCVETLEDAARYRLMVVFHGCAKPSGLDKTYPNELTREAIYGLEYGCAHAEQDVLTPFTRFLAGPADYTPMAFQSNRLGNTTEAHQIAQTLLFTSPFRCYGGRPEDFLSHPARNLFLHIPVVWDETRVLPPSEIGSCVVMARRKGNEWYIAALTVKPIKFDIPLSILLGSREGVFKADIVADDAGGTQKCRVNHLEHITSNSIFTVQMSGGGGWVVRISI